MSDDVRTTAAEPAMETIPSPPPSFKPGSLEHELGHLAKDWWWFLLLGILLIFCGTVAIAYSATFSMAAVVVLGAMLIVAGVATVISSFWAGQWSAMLLQLLVGILYLIVGIAIMDAPADATAVMTLFIAAFFIVVGIFRTVAALVLKFPQWGWALLNGIITLLVGIMIYKHFPESAVWLIGLLVGIEMIFNGWTWVMLSLAVRNLQVQQHPQPLHAK